MQQPQIYIEITRHAVYKLYVHNIAGKTVFQHDFMTSKASLGNVIDKAIRKPLFASNTAFLRDL